MSDGMDNAASYFRDREHAERTLANKAASPIIRDIHLELAERYRQLADDMDMSNPSKAFG